MRTLALLALLWIASVTQAQVFTITVEGGKSDLTQVPVRAPLSLAPKEMLATHVEITDGKRTIPGQLANTSVVGVPTVIEKGHTLRELHFILPELRADQKLTLKCTLLSGDASPRFQWTDNKDGSTTLALHGKADTRPVLRYMHKAYDPSTSDARNKTYKVFHHVYDPAGKTLVTNGGHTDSYTDEKKLLFPHHRGIMFAFNKITYGPDLKKSADTWHAKPKDTHQSHQKVLSEDIGPVLGRHRVLIAWHGPDKEVFAQEERELTAYNTDGGTLIEFATRLKTTGGKVKLDGDPQHAGFQFRAANEVGEKGSAAQTYYLRPWGKGEPGKEANWPADKRQVNLPWHVLSLLLGKQRYSVAYIDHPSNPGEKRYSERLYGRFGCYFENELTEDRPLVLNHRLWLQQGEMNADAADALRAAFADPPRVTVSR